jgi:hypothetical protein
LIIQPIRTTSGKQVANDGVDDYGQSRTIADETMGCVLASPLRIKIVFIEVSQLHQGLNGATTTEGVPLKGSVFFSNVNITKYIS